MATLPCPMQSLTELRALALFHLHVGGRLAMRAAAPLDGRAVGPIGLPAPDADRLRILEPLARGEALDPAAH